MLKTAVTFVWAPIAPTMQWVKREEPQRTPKVRFSFSLAAAALPTVLNILEVDPWHAGTDQMALSMPYDPD